MTDSAHNPADIPPNPDAVSEHLLDLISAAGLASIRDYVELLDLIAAPGADDATLVRVRPIARRGAHELARICRIIAELDIHQRGTRGAADIERLAPLLHALAESLVLIAFADSYEALLDEPILTGPDLKRNPL